MTPILDVRNLFKKYKELVAVNDISFSIPPGVCFGLLGPNGAGKTTCIEVIENVIPPTSGEILYKGKPRGASFREEVGIQFQQTTHLYYLSVLEILQTFKRLYRKTYDLTELMELCSLTDIRKQQNDKISGGQKQRLSLALALLNDPDLLFLDEPSTGLDPQSRRNLWRIIGSVKAKGKTIILTTHYMEEAQLLCDDIAIMDHGQFIARGKPDQLIRQYCKGFTVILPKESLKEPLHVPGLYYHEVRDTVEIQTEDINGCMVELIAHHVDLSDIVVRSPNLEDVFIKLTGRKLRE